MNNIDKEKQEKEKQIVADVWNLHIIEVSLFLNIISKLCSFSPVVADILGTCTVILTIILIVRLIMLKKGRITPRYRPHQIIVTGFVLFFNAIVRVFVDSDSPSAKYLLIIAVLAFAFYAWKELWKGEIRRGK